MRRQNLDDTEWCDRLLGEVSRTFALSIRCLPDALRGAVRTAYLLCRIVDTVEDDRTIGPVARQQLFDAFDAALGAATYGALGPAAEFAERAAACALGSDSERALARGAVTVFASYASLPRAQRGALRPRVQEMSQGMREYAARADRHFGLRTNDVADLERYCHFVAGTVGELLTDLFADACPVDAAVRAGLDARASRFGIGLQLVNILKDVAEDYARGDCFLPLSTASDHGVSLERLFDPAERSRGLALCRVLSHRAREHLEAAEEYTLLWPHRGPGRDARAFCAGPLALALGTLRRVELGSETLVSGRAPAVSRDFVIGVFTDLGRAMETVDPAAADARLRALFDRARIGVAGRSSRPPAPPVWAQHTRPEDRHAGEATPMAGTH